MMYYLLCFGVFAAAYLVNMIYISLFYHRGLTHGAVKLRPWLETFVAQTGNWVTGIDVKSWVCMHRLHHQYSDTPDDPHSPVYKGVFPLMLAQLHSYEKAISGLIRGHEPYTSTVSDLKFSVNWLNRKKLWMLPYILHALIAISIGYFGDAWLLGACYWLGMMTHPLQGWMVNALAHSYGYRNFDISDNSRNNTFVAWFVMGEGFQNNHHRFPNSAKFSVKWWEIDLGYALCLFARAIGWIDIPKHVEDPIRVAGVPSTAKTAL